jgi:Non-repetitive/WGA-negative nucleoporin C-terminal
MWAIAYILSIGHEAELLQLSDQYNDQLSKYLEETHHLKLAWMHDLRLKKYDRAFQTLERIAESEPVLTKKKVLQIHASVKAQTTYFSNIWSPLEFAQHC